MELHYIIKDYGLFGGSLIMRAIIDFMIVFGVSYIILVSFLIAISLFEGICPRKVFLFYTFKLILLNYKINKNHVLLIISFHLRNVMGAWLVCELRNCRKEADSTVFSRH